MPKSIVFSYFACDRAKRVYRCTWKADGAGCSYASRQKSNMQVHVMSHLKVRPFSCKHCLKDFTTKQNLQDHEIRHEGKRMYKCPIETCSWSFFRKRELIKHGLTNAHSRFDYEVFLKHVEKAYPYKRHPTVGADQTATGLKDTLLVAPNDGPENASCTKSGLPSIQAVLLKVKPGSAEKSGEGVGRQTKFGNLS